MEYNSDGAAFVPILIKERKYRKGPEIKRYI
jgi:hypothetical protein